ncbi:GATA zinc finger domain-containing protein 14 isoform X2 [Galleria mellonella]|nr:GATA zinc finger domain-containing protein 14 isoform X2 [Galleria mellonella]XP_052748213.1 GATA zinc finger domain-containing protein 14 isoform X2 [Galleria mellonella]
MSPERDEEINVIIDKLTDYINNIMLEHEDLDIRLVKFDIEAHSDDEIEEKDIQLEITVNNCPEVYQSHAHNIKEINQEIEVNHPENNDPESNLRSDKSIEDVNNNNNDDGREHTPINDENNEENHTADSSDETDQSVTNSNVIPENVSNTRDVNLPKDYSDDKTVPQVLVLDLQENRIEQNADPVLVYVEEHEDQIDKVIVIPQNSVNNNSDHVILPDSRNSAEDRDSNSEHNEPLANNENQIEEISTPDLSNETVRESANTNSDNENINNTTNVNEYPTIVEEKQEQTEQIDRANIPENSEENVSETSVEDAGDNNTKTETDSNNENNNTSNVSNESVEQYSSNESNNENVSNLPTDNTKGKKAPQLKILRLQENGINLLKTLEQRGKKVNPLLVYVQNEPISNAVTSQNSEININSSNEANLSAVNDSSNNSREKRAPELMALNLAENGRALLEDLETNGRKVNPLLVYVQQHSGESAYVLL